MDFDKNKYKVYTWKNWMILHWILNPGLVINELILGQRIPKVSLEDRTSDKPRIERTLVPCPHCNTLHDGRTWSTENGTAFKNWFGLYCVNCGNIIPCLMNAFSFLILAITFPLWGWFRNSLKAKWLKKQPERFKDIDVEKIPNDYDRNNWLKSALGFGVVMFLFSTFFFHFIDGHEITWEKVGINLVICAISGLLFGFILKIYLNKKGDKKGESSTVNNL